MTAAAQRARAYVATAFILIAAYAFLPPAGRQAAFLIVSASAIPPLVFAARRLPADDRRPWWLLLAAVIIVNVGIIVRLFPGDGALVAGQLLDGAGNALVLAAALALVLRQGRNDIGGIIDSTIVALAVGGLLWDVVLLPNLIDDYQRIAAEADLFIVVFALSGVLGALGRLLQVADPPVTAVWSLIAALAFAWGGNVVLALSTAPGLHVAAYMMFMITYVSLALFGLDRTAARLVQPESTPAPEELSIGRLVFLGAAVAVIPIVVGGRAVLGANVDGLLLIFGGASVAVLVMVRIGYLSAARNRAEAALRYEATHDSLTGLANRRDFMAQLGDQLARDPDLVIIFCDLDGFKAVNDRLGHAAGDQLLIEVAQRLRAGVRERDVVSRFGGDEFLVLCSDAALPDIEQARDWIAASLSRPFRLCDERVTVGASLGLAAAKGEVDPERLVRRADQAMYVAKRAAPPGPGVRIVAA